MFGIKADLSILKFTLEKLFAIFHFYCEIATI